MDESTQSKDVFINRKQGSEGIKSGLVLPKRFSEVKQPRISKKDIVKVREWMKQYDPDLQVFNKLLANIRCIDDNQLKVGIQQMEKSIAQFVGSGPYHAFIDGFGHGGGYIYNRLQLKKPATSIISHEDNPNFLRQAMEIQPHDKVVYIDDASYTGGQFDVYLHSLMALSRVSPDNILVALVGLTNQALHYISSKLKTPNITATFYIPQIIDIFNPQERGVIKEFSDVWMGNTDSAVLTYFSTHKVPDNFIGSLRRTITQSRKLPYLIDDTKSGIYPPYRR